MVSPLSDSPDDIRAIPENLSRSGLHVPTFVAFESPIPGTPISTPSAGRRILRRSCPTSCCATWRIHAGGEAQEILGRRIRRGVSRDGARSVLRKAAMEQDRQ